MRYVSICLVATVLAGCKGSPGSSSLQNDRDKTSYAIGLNLGKTFKTDSIAINPEMFLRGVQDAMDDSSKKLLNEQEAQQVLSLLDQSIREKRMAAGSALAMKNKKEGEDFLEQNKKKDGVVTLPSGLQYEVLIDGTGPMPKPEQTVETRYKGMLVDGTEFDGSEKHGGTVTFRVGEVIPGWREALEHMKVGSKWKLFIPSQLAYGPGGAGGIIGPNAALVFELELIAIK